MPRFGVLITVLVLPLLAGACSHPTANPPGAADSVMAHPATDADPGLELTTFVSGVDAHTLAGALTPFVDQPVPLGRDLEDLWAAYGFRIVSVPVERVPALVQALQTSGSTQRQWLGQAYSWTEVVRAGQSSGRVIALDAERIRLAPGALRLLVRSWIEPTPPQVTVGEVVNSGGGGGGGVGGGGGDAAPGATLRVEIVPQNRESRTPEQALDPLAVNEPRLEAEGQGLLFSRLYTRMSMMPGHAIVIVPDRPDADWKTLAAEPATRPATEAALAPKRTLDDPDAVSWGKPGPSGTPTPAATTADAPPVRVGPPKLGEVVRAAPRPAEPVAKPADAPADVGPVAARVPTLGEAMLMGDAPQHTATNGSARRAAAPPQRVLLVLVPRVPKEFRLLGPMPGGPSPAVAPATPSAARPLPG